SVLPYPYTLTPPPPTPPLFPYTTLFRSSDTCYSRRSHHLPLTRTSVVVQRNFLITKKLMISKPISAKEIHEDSCGKSGQSETPRSEEHTSELQSRFDLVCRLLLEKKKRN